MESYLSKWEAIASLHERGFTDDFKLNGNRLLWIQQKMLLHPEEFSIIECHFFDDDQTSEFIIYGIISTSYSAKGILINHDKNDGLETADIIPKITEKHLHLPGYNSAVCNE